MKLFVLSGWLRFEFKEGVTLWQHDMADSLTILGSADTNTLSLMPIRIINVPICFSSSKQFIPYKPSRVEFYLSDVKCIFTSIELSSQVESEVFLHEHVAFISVVWSPSRATSSICANHLVDEGLSNLIRRCPICQGDLPQYIWLDFSQQERFARDLSYFKRPDVSCVTLFHKLISWKNAVAKSNCRYSSDRFIHWPQICHEKGWRCCHSAATQSRFITSLLFCYWTW